MTSLMVATHGGHISELVNMAGRITNLEEPLWVTSQHPQTSQLMQGRSVEFVPIIESRDAVGVIRAIPKAIGMIRRRRVDRVISTGSAIALAYLPVAAALRVPAHYIESSTRVQAPSITGKLLQRIPGITMWWQVGRPPKGWRQLPGVFAEFDVEPRPEPRSIRSIVVTVGTTHYGFERLIRRLVETLPSDIDVFWQVGDSDTTGLAIDAHDIVDEAELDRRIAEADVVITHAGAGSLLKCLQSGHVAVCVPRLASHNEQVDEHQVELAEWADQAGLAINVDAASIAWTDLEASASLQVVRRAPQLIELEV